MSLATVLNTNKNIDLNKLVNLALNSPKVGIVNFTILKTFLIELLKALNLQNYEPKLGDDHETKHLLQDILKLNEEQENINQQDSSHIENENDTTGYGSEMINTSVDGSGSTVIGILSGKGGHPLDTKALAERYFGLEDKLSRLEQQISALNSLPTNTHLIEKAKESRKAHSATGPIMEMWQYTQLSKRLESNEEGLTKLTSLMQDLIGDLNELKDSQVKNSSEVSQLKENYNSLLDKLKHLEKMKDNFPTMDQIKDLERELDLLRDGLKDVDKINEKLRLFGSQIRSIEITISSLVNRDEMEDYVTWAQLEASLKGIKDMLDTATANMNRKSSVTPNIKTSSPVVPTSHATQTTPLPQTPLPQAIRTPSAISRPGTSKSNPSDELREILLRLGTLNQRHENLKEVVDDLQEKAGKPKTPTPSSAPVVISQELPDDLASKLDEIMKIKSELIDLRNNFNQETNKRQHLETLLAHLNTEIEKLKNALKDALSNNRLTKENIAELQEAIKSLEQSKVDKDWIGKELDRKADKRDLDNKVHRKLFDDTHNEMSHNINNCIQKTNGLEDDFNKKNDRMLKELESKLDRMELDPFKDYIEKQLRKIKKLHKEAQGTGTVNPEDDAAGMRKQLLKFHCISCDRPIEATPQAPFPSLPNEKGMRPIQSPRPFTTYELEQIRQFQKAQTFQDQSYDLFASVRQCGGTHTLTLPHKKFVKVPPQIIEEVATTPIPATPVTVPPTYRSEVQIQGQDGHIYKGRIDAKLTVEMKKPKNSNHSHANGNNKNNNSGSINLLLERPSSAADKNPQQNNNNNNNNQTDTNSTDQIPVYIN